MKAAVPRAWRLAGALMLGRVIDKALRLDYHRQIKVDFSGGERNMPLRIQGTSIPLPSTTAPPAAPAAAPTSKCLPISLIGQKQTNWCWAACGEMVLVYKGIANVSQCDLASWLFSDTCCNVPCPTACNKAAWPDQAYSHWNVAFMYFHSQITFILLQNNINGNNPIEVYYEWSTGGAHVALISGWYDNNEVQVNDPWYSAGRISYAEVQSAYGLGNWTGTYTF